MMKRSNFTRRDHENALESNLDFPKKLNQVRDDPQFRAGKMTRIF